MFRQGVRAAMVSGRFCYFLGLLALLGAPAAMHASDPPNVVLIIGDDISYRDYGFMGAKHVATPHLDRLAREGMTYTRGYVPTSLCRASLMSIITGLYPHQHGIVGNDPPKGEDRGQMLWAIRRHTTIPKLLTKQGYYCYQTGKWWEGAAAEGGFAAGMTHGDLQRGGRHGDEGLKIGRETLAPIQDAIASAKKEKKPFFIWYAPMLPHTPHDPPEDLIAKYQANTASIHVARYRANVERFDRTIGELQKLLESADVAKSTLTIYLHDNGWIQDPSAGKFAPRSKRSPYQVGIRTPLLLHLPGRIAPGRDDTTFVSSVDVAPTIFAACGANPVKNLPGSNLLPAEAESVLKRESVLGASFSHDVAALSSPQKGLEQRWCVIGNWKLIFDHKTSECELYDLERDPDEAKNMASAHPEIARSLLRRLDAWWDGAQVATESSELERLKP
jgi:arylsulfatase A-like enzyme